MPTLVRNSIIVSSNPRGVFKEGTLGASVTPKPGTCMQLQSDGTYLPFTSADGAIQPVLILLPDWPLGGYAGGATVGTSATPELGTAYAASSHIFMYYPAMGEEFMMLIKDISGTGDDHAVGELLMINQTTGKLIVDSSGAMKPFQLQEAITDPVADQLALCVYTGN